MNSKPTRRRLQLCAGNPLARRDDIRRQLEGAGCVIEVEDCLDQCTRCAGCAFALVAGEYLFAATPEEFLRKVTRKDSRRTLRKS